MSRRNFLAGSAGLVALSLLAPLARAGQFQGIGEWKPGTWLGRIMDDAGSGFRIVPGAPAPASLRSDQPLVVRLGGPWSLADGEPLPDVTLKVLYRYRPDHPYHIWKKSPDVGPVNLRIHSPAAGLAGIEVSCRNQATLCELTDLSRPVLAPGRYAMIIDPGARNGAPDWSSLRLDASGQRIQSLINQPGLAAVLLDVVVDH